MPWVSRGLRNGVLTTPYPRQPDGYGHNWRGAIRVREEGAPTGVREEGAPTGACEELCPTNAISSATSGLPSVDRGRCILCHRCVTARPDLFSNGSSPEVASEARQGLVVPATEESEAAVMTARTELARRARTLRRSVHVRHVDAGSDGSEEWEIMALLGPVYDIHRLGVFFTASPRHADLLLVTGAGSAGMAGPLRATYEAMPGPKIVLAVGADAISGGMISPTYATHGGVGNIVPVDVWVPGSPPSPFSILHGVLLAVGVLVEAGGRR